MWPESSRTVVSIPSSPASAEPAAFLVIPAGGRGLRLGGGIPKQFRDWGGIPLLLATLRAFLAPGMPRLEAISLAVPEDYLETVGAWSLEVPLRVTVGGETRQTSVLSALRQLPERLDMPVLVHDGVRPFPPAAPIREALASLSAWDGALLGEPSTDTLKQVDGEGRVLATVARDVIYRAQTPQVARLGTWLRAFEAAEAAGFTGTDDVSLLERLGLRVRLVVAPSSNLKLTTAEDWERHQPRPVVGTATTSPCPTGNKS